MAARGAGASLVRARDEVHVVGPSGTEGSAVIDFLLSRGATRIVGHDLSSGPEEFGAAFRRTHQWLGSEEGRAALARLLASPVMIRYRDRYLEGVVDADLIVVPQSWHRHPENAPLRDALARGIPFTSMTRLFFETCPCPIIGVTGTNGKFTVATLVFQMLRAAGRPAFISGNDRTHVPMLYELDRITPDAWLVLEISNRQLMDLPYSPHVGVITNVAPHHLDDHGTLENYVRVKATLIRHQGPEDFAVLNLDNAHTRAMAAGMAARVRWFSAQEGVERGACVRNGILHLVEEGRAAPILASRDLRVPGEAMVENALAACAAAACADVAPGVMAAVLRGFEGLPHRFSYAGESGGIAFYEDSLATNPTAAAAAIRSLDRPFLLIAGGLRRNARPEDFRPMVDAVAASGLCKAALLIGSTASQLEEAFTALPEADRPSVVRAGTLEQAMVEARRLSVDGDAVLLSPGCESFDQFADYRARGDRFRELARAFSATA